MKAHPVKPLTVTTIRRPTIHVSTPNPGPTSDFGQLRKPTHRPRYDAVAAPLRTKFLHNNISYEVIGRIIGDISGSFYLELLIGHIT